MKFLKKLKRKFKIKHELLLIILIVGLFFCSGMLLWVSSLKLPDLSTVSLRQISESTKIYDRTGTILLYDVHQNTKRTIVKTEEISPFIKQAAVAIEDDKFYEHIGVRPVAFLRAVFANILSGEYSQGGSTITQQVIKNSILTTEKSITRKIKEWILAIKLEKVATKDEILTLYLNEAPYGGNVYGVEEASLTFFGKHANEVTLTEAAYLAALPNAPTYYSPHGDHKDALEKRKNSVLQKMFELGFIDEKTLNDALTEQVTFLPMENLGIKAPHFVMYVKSILEKEYGQSRIENEGFKVITSIDYELQTKAEEIAHRYAYENEIKYNAENAGVVAIDSKTGEILAMVGSRDYFDNAIDGNFNITTAHRQPGSSFKPFVYATALTKGYTPDTIVFDVKTEFSTFCNPDGTPIYEGDADKCYMPENYDHIYRGPVTFKEAIAQSINVPAIKALYLAGLKDSLSLAQSMGIKSLEDVNRYGLTLVLGGGEVSLLDMTSAYTVFANNGVRNDAISILRIEDNDGNIIFQSSKRPRIVLDDQVARQITDMLSDNNARAPAFGYYSPLYFPSYDVAAKTGTTNDYKDAWIIGYTTEITIGAWAGNNDNTSMEKKVAGYIVAPMWNEIMKKAIELYPPNNFEKPRTNDSLGLPPVLRGKWQGGISTIIDTRTGMLATETTPVENQFERLSGGIHSILYWLDKNNPRKIQAGYKNDPQFNLWEYAVQKWAVENDTSMTTNIDINTQTATSPTPEIDTKPFIYFKNLDPEKFFGFSENMTLSVGIVHDKQIKKVEYFVNGQKIGESITSPFNFTFKPESVVGIKGFNALRAVATDTNNVQGDVNSSFRAQ